MRDHACLADNMLVDLAAFTGCELSYAEWQVEHGWQLNHSAWLARKPLTAHARQDYYRTNDTYMWELAGWNLEPGRRAITDRVATFARNNAVKSVVDYGGGLGTDILSIAMNCSQADCVLMEVNTLCREFALWRAQKYGIRNFRVVEPVAIPQVDLVICLDVLEHVEAPDELLTAILMATKLAVLNFSGNFIAKDFPMHLPQNVEARTRFAKRLRAFDTNFNADALYMGPAAGGQPMIREVKGTPFLIGSFVDGERQDRQAAANVIACLKCTHQLVGGASEKRFPIHQEYFNINLDDTGACPTDGTNPFFLVRSWMQNVDAMAREQGGKVLIHSYTGMGKAVRLVAAHLAGWKKAAYAGALELLCKECGISASMLLQLPAFEAALVGTLEDVPMQAPVPKSGERKGAKMKRPKLD